MQAWNITQKFKKVTFKHTLRENNKEADEYDPKLDGTMVIEEEENDIMGDID